MISWRRGNSPTEAYLWTPLVGAHAVSLGVTLVTNNTREFKRIANLKVADWTV
jgi:predicted nucleic acid-binding protein